MDTIFTLVFKGFHFPPNLYAVKELLVSAGDNLQVTLPENEVELHAYVVTPTLPGEFLI